MAIDIKFDLIGNPEPPTIILANRNGNKLGQLKVDIDSIELSDKFNDASEFSFILNKNVDNKIIDLWDSVVDFKLVYCKEWDMWFEISVELDEDTKTTKTVLCKQLGQAELSQIMLYDIEINTEKDIERDDYKITILWNSEDPEASMLHRLLKDKAPHYSIAHVDFTIANMQRSFSFDSISIYDAFQKIAEEIGCIFIFHSDSDENGRIRRAISVYDLEQNCMNIDCGYRGEFTHVCPKCGSTDIKNGYGDDTLIFVTSDELAANGIKFTTDVDSVKNCFKLEAGDDLMTATIRNCNPNGTDYIWYFSEDLKKNMSNELVGKISSYDELYKDYYNNYKSNMDANLLNSYNELVKKYSVYNEDLQPLTNPIIGYPSLMNAYYNTVDLSLYLESGLMPSIEMAETNAKEQVELLEDSFLRTVSVANIDTISLATANSAVLSMAKIIIRSTFKIKIETSELINNADSTKTWRGNFIVTNYSDEEDTATSGFISVAINGDLEEYVRQKIDKALNKENTDDYSISGLFKKEYNEFCSELKKYALNPLIRFHDAAQACIDILVEQGVGDESSPSWDDPDNNLYNSLYLPYYEKLQAIEAEMQIREREINLIKGEYNSNNELISDGISTYIIDAKDEIQKALNFEKYLGKDLLMEFCSYRREDKYSNPNYISDGLDNAELFDRALEFIDVAEKEIYKSAELQHSISTTLRNLLAIDKFKPLVNSFNVGNWIRVQINDEIYKLRLLEYGISFGNFNDISVEFSDVTKVKNGITDIQDILSQASSMASSYEYTQSQAEQGNNASGTISQWLANGLNSALVRIQSNDNEEITLTKNGLLARSYDEITDDYSPEQLKLTHNIMAYTDDNWRTVKQAIGKHNYVTYNSSADGWVQSTGYGMSAEFVTAGQVMGSKIVGGEIYSSNYHKGVIGNATNKPCGTYINLTTGDFRFGGDKLIFDTSDDALTLRNVTIKWDSTNPPEMTDISGLGEYAETANDAYQLANAANSVATNAKEIGDMLVSGLGFEQTEITGRYIISPVIAGGHLLIGDKTGTYAQITTDGKLTCTNADISGHIEATSGSFTGTVTATDGEFSGVIHARDGEFTGTITATNSTFSGTINGSEFIGGSIKSTNYSQGVSGTYINLNDGYFEVGGGDLTYANSSLTLGKHTVGSNVSLCGGLGNISYVIGDNSYDKLKINSNGLIDITGNFTLQGSNIKWTNTIEANPQTVTMRSKCIDTGVFASISADSSNQTSASIVLIADKVSVATEKLIPSYDNHTTLGESGKVWTAVYAKIGTIQTSDEREKENIVPLGENLIVPFSLNNRAEQIDIHSELFDRLQPVQYNFVNGNGRICYGLVAQQVVSSMEEVGIGEDELDLVHHDYWIDESTGEEKDSYGLSYTNLIAMLIHEVQKLKAKNGILEERISSLS